MMQTVPVNIVGQTYESRSRPLSVQVCRNLYPEVNPSSKTPTALQSFPGNKIFYTQSVIGADRGIYRFNDELYKVSGTSLYKYTSTGSEYLIGTISGGSPCVFANNGSVIVIVTGGVVYQYNGVSLSIATDADFESPNSVAYLKTQMLYDGDGGRFAVSDAGAPTTITGTYYATAESAGDPLIRVYVFNQIAYMMGSETIEPWYDSGVGEPPFNPVDGVIIEKGLHAIYSVANTEQYIYFLGSDKNVYRLVGYQVENVTSPAIGNFLENNTVDDARGFVMKLQGQNIYVLSLKTANKTLCYSETTGTWFELSAGVSGDMSKISSYAYCYGKHLVGDYSNGNIYELDLDTFQDNTEVYRRERITPPISGDMFQKPGAVFSMSKFSLIMETGVGTTTGSDYDVDPSVVFSASYDGGKSWTNERWVKIGRLGEVVRVDWYHLVAGVREIVIKWYVTANVFASFHSASIDVEETPY